MNQRWTIKGVFLSLSLTVTLLINNPVFGQGTSEDPVNTAAAQLQIPAGLFSQPATYTCHFTKDAINVDGQLTEKAWQEVSYSARFGDILGASVAKGQHKDQSDDILPTQVKMRWNNQYLFIGAKLTESHIRGFLKQRDTIVFHDNDFEVFIDPNNTTRSYFEFEVNTLNTLLDLFMPQPYSNGGNAVITWDAKGILHQVSLQGTLNKHNDQDSGWTVEMAIPFAALQLWGKSAIPEEGQLWRINFSRVEWDYDETAGQNRKKRGANGRLLPEHNWTWTPQGVTNMHMPERWGYLIFAKNRPYTTSIPFIERQKQLLWQLYYLQKAYFQKNKTFALTLDALGLKKSTIQRKWNGKKVISVIGLEATSRQFIMTLTDVESHLECTIDQLGNLRENHIR